jgi:hypothetical protein
MREELLVHLTCLFDEERSRNDDIESAATAAIARFGEATTLTADLQASVPWLERWALARLPYSGPLRRRPAESPGRYVLRSTCVGLACGTISMAIVLLIVVAAQASKPHRMNEPVGSQILLYMLGTAAILYPGTIAIGLLCEQMRQALERLAAARTASERHHANGRIALYTALGSAVWGCSAAGMMLLLNSGIPNFMSNTHILSITLGASAAGIPLTLLQARDWLLTNRRFENWDSLELDEPSVA